MARSWRPHGFSWLFFLVRGRSLASTVDRGEVMVLKPLSITYLLLAIALAISSAWLSAAVSVLAWLLNGAVGAALHKSRTLTEITEGDAQHMQKGPRVRLSDADSRLLASVTLRATMILGVVLMAVLVQYWLRWYLALPAAFVGAWILIASSMILVCYQKKPSSHTAG